MAHESVLPPDDTSQRFDPVPVDLADLRLRRSAAQSVADAARRDNLLAGDDVVLMRSQLDEAHQLYERGVAAGAAAPETTLYSLAVDTAVTAHRAATVVEADTSAALALARRLLAVVATTDEDRTSIRMEVTTEADLITVRPYGELDMSTSPRLERVVTDELDAGQAERVFVDLQDVTFMDSSALAVLVEIRRVSMERRVDFALTGVGPRTQRLLQLSRLDGIFTIV